MALIEYDVYKQKLRDLEPELKKLGDALDIDAVAQEAARLEDETTQDGFWNNLERSQKVQTRLKQLQNKLHRFKKLMSWRITLFASYSPESSVVIRISSISVSNAGNSVFNSSRISSSSASWPISHRVVRSSQVLMSFLKRWSLF